MAADILSPFNLTNAGAVTTGVDAYNAAKGPGAYSDNMWYNLQSLHDVGVQMALMEKYRLASIYRAMVPTAVAMRTATGAVAEEMSWKGVFAMEPNTTPVGRRQIWYGSNFTDTYSKKITFLDYADKVALHRYDDLIQAYRFRGSVGMYQMASTLLGETITLALDILARNAFLEAPFFWVIDGGTGTITPLKKDATSLLPDFSAITETDVFDFEVSRQAWEALAYQDHPMAANPNGASGTLLCVTTPSTPMRIKEKAQVAGTIASEWRESNLYANPNMLLTNEVGMFENVRYIQTRRNVLWNCGTIKTQAAVTADVGPGDGASAQLVDGVYKVGQNAAAAGIVNYVEIDTIGLGGDAFAVGDIVTIHQTRTADFGVTNGVDYREGTARVRRVVEVSATLAGATPGIAFDKPVFMEYAAGSAWITKGVHVHTSVYVAGPGVVNGVGEPIMFYPKEPIDDANAIWRVIWQGRFKYQMFEPGQVNVVYHGGGNPPVFGIGTAS